VPGSNNFEHGPIDQPVTTANSGDVGLGNTAANLVQITAGHTMTYDDDWAAHGTRSVKITSNSTAGTYLRFTPDAGDRQVLDVYFTIPAYPTGGSFPIMTATGASTAGFKAVIGTTGTVSLQNAAGSGVSGSVSTATVPLGTKARLSVECIKGSTTSNGTLSYRLFYGTNVEGTTPDATFTSGATVNTGTVQVNNLYFGKGTSAGTAASVSIDDVRFMAHATDWYAPIGADVVDVRRVPALGKIALIGDSQFELGGEANIRTQLARVGWTTAADIYFHGVGGKTLTTADSTGTTTIQNVAAARTALGSEPALWVINLGGNSSGVPEATFRNGVKGILDAIGDANRVLWFGIQGNPNTAARATATEWLRQEVVARPLARYVDTTAWIHDGRDETGLWNADAIHMLTAGYTLRNAWVADRANRYRTEVIGSSTTMQTAAVGSSASVRSGGSVASVTANDVEAGRKVARASSTASVTAGVVGAGRKVGRAGSVAATTAGVTASGQKRGSGSSVALTTAATVQAGRKVGRAGSVASTIVTAVGAGIHPTAGTGGSAVGVSVGTVGSSVARRIGSSIVTAQVVTVGAGARVAASVRTGGSTTSVAVSVAGIGRNPEEPAVLPDPGDLVIAGSPSRNPFTVSYPRRNL
jgi:hypothetical protein